VAPAVERSVWLGRQLTFPMRAERGKHKKFLAFADDKESLVPGISVDAIAGVTAPGTRVHYPFCRCSLGNRLAGCKRGSGQKQELSSSNVFAHPVLSVNQPISEVEDKAGNCGPVLVVALQVVQRKSDSKANPRLRPADGF
jgi:hypothetical protein